MMPIGNLYILVSYQNLLFKHSYQIVVGEVNETYTCEGTQSYMEKMNLGTRDTFRSFSHDLIHHTLSKFDHDMSFD
jgi:hypothetical protein